MKNKNYFFFFTLFFLAFALQARPVSGPTLKAKGEGPADPPVLTIQQIQQTPDDLSGPSPYAGQVVQFSGVVTARGFNGYYVQDGSGAWSGIYVQHFFNGAAVGQHATITGTVFEFENETVIQSPSYVVNSSGQELPDPVLISSGQMGEPYEGVLVSLQNAVCISAEPSSWVVDDGSGPLTIGGRFFSFSPEIGTSYAITAIGSQNNNGFLLFPRSSEDLGESVSLSYDIGIDAFNGPLTAEVGQQAVYTVQVKNHGTQTAEDYRVDLLVNGNQAVTLTGSPLDPEQSLDFLLSWQPEFPGNFEVATKVVFLDDENPENNMEGPLEVLVTMQDGSLVITVGGQQNSDFSRLPVKLDNRYSMSQQIFFASELNASGPIAKLGFDTNFEKEEVIHEPMQIWMKETSQDNLSEGWIPTDGFQLVFDGLVSYPPGLGSIVIELDTIFQYSGKNNLVIMAFTEVTAPYPHVWCNFFYSNDASHPGRSRWVSSNTAFEVATPPEGETIGQHANTSFYIWTQPTGSLSGHITNPSGEPLADVRVAFGQDFFVTATDENGDYYLPFVFEGNEMLSASLFGYYAFSEEISISAGQENIMDIVMQPLPGITVSGQLVANYDESVGIAGAAVRLEGYADFSTVSDAGGFFSLEGVYGDQEYVLGAEAEGYEPFFQTFLVPSEDTDLGALSLQESPLPPGNILAEETDNGEVQVSWTFPGEGYPEYEIAFDHNFPTNAMNWDELGGECAVRFTPMGYPARVTGGAVNIWDGNWPQGVQLLSFEIAVYAADGPSGSPSVPDDFPGTELARISVKPDHFGWVTFDFSQHEIILEEGDFYISFIQTAEAPQAPPLAIDGLDPAFRNYIRYPGDTYWWGFHPTFNDFMIRARVTGPGSNTQKQEVMLYPAKGPAQPFQDLSSLPEGLVYDHALNNLPDYAFNGKSRLVESFNLYRLNAGQEQNPDSWTLLQEQSMDTSFVDTSFPELETGTYRFAVQAIYFGGISSSFIFSESIEKGLTTSLTLQVESSAGISPRGAVIELLNTDSGEKREFTLSDNAELFLERVYKGTYLVRAWLEDHAFFMQENIPVQDNETLQLEMQAIIYELESLKGEAEGETVSLSWEWERASNVLFIDDDSNCNHPDLADVQPFYLHLLDTLGMDYDLIELTEDMGDGPDLATLLQFDLVVWDAGENYAQNRTLTVNDEANLSSYLDQGGRLILSAQDYLFDRYPDVNNLFPGQFPYDYLGVWGTAQDAIMVGQDEFSIPSATLLGAPGTFVEGLSVDFENVFTTMFVDLLFPNEKARPFIFIDQTPVALVTKNTLFTTAALPGMVDGQHEALAFLDKIINGFSQPAPGSQTLLGFSLYRNGELIAENLEEMQYEDAGLPNGVYEYGIQAHYPSGVSQVLTVTVEVSQSTVDVNDPVEDARQVLSCFPNPFTEQLVVSYTLPASESVLLDVYDIRGQHIVSLVNESQAPGTYQAIWNGKTALGTEAPAGVYFIRMRSGSQVFTQKTIKN